MPLLALPNELLLEIARYLKPKDLSHLILTNRRLASLLYTRLYKFAVNDWRYGTSALYSAATNENHRFVNLLLKNGANSAGIEKHGRTVFQRLACDNEAAALRVILEHGVDINERDQVGRTALQLAVRCEKSLDSFKALLELGADVNVHEPKNGYTPLHTAVYMQSPIAVELLLRKGADINSRNLVGETPLHLAGWKTLHELGDKNFDYMVDESSRGFFERKIIPFEGKITRNEVLTRLLLENGADIDALDEKRQTPLHLAASIGNGPILRLLIRNGADFNIKDSKGLTPLDYIKTIEKPPKAPPDQQEPLAKDGGRRQLLDRFRAITRRIRKSHEVRDLL